MNLRWLVLALFLATFTLLAAGCSIPGVAVDTAKDIIAQRDEIVRLYHVTQGEASNFQLTVDTEYAKIRATTSQAASYYDAVVRSGEVWTGNFEDEQALMNQLLEQYAAQYGGVSPEQLNLQQMAEQGMLPDNLGSGFALYVNAVVQAPPPVPDAVVTTQLMATTNESMETIRAAGVYWNAAVTNYNAYRQKVSSEVIAAASELLGFPLPDTLPYYRGGHTGPVENPIDDND